MFRVIKITFPFIDEKFGLVMFSLTVNRIGRNKYFFMIFFKPKATGKDSPMYVDQHNLAYLSKIY